MSLLSILGGRVTYAWFHFGGVSPRRCLRNADQQVVRFLLAILLLICIIIFVNAGCLKLFSGTWHSYLCLGLHTWCILARRRQEMFKKRWPASCPVFAWHSTLSFHAGGLRLDQCLGFKLLTRGELLRKRCWKKAEQRVVRFLFGNLLLIRLGVISGSAKIFSGTWRSYQRLGSSYWHIVHFGGARELFGKRWRRRCLVFICHGASNLHYG